MNRNCRCYPDKYSHDTRLEKKETPKTKKCRKKMKRKGKKTSSQHVAYLRIFREISDILDKTKSDTHKRTHNRRIGHSEGLEPLGYFFMKWCPENIVYMLSYTVQKNHECYEKWKNRKPMKTLPKRRKSNTEKYKW